MTPVWISAGERYTCTCSAWRRAYSDRRHCVVPYNACIALIYVLHDAHLGCLSIRVSSDQCTGSSAAAVLSFICEEHTTEVCVCARPSASARHTQCLGFCRQLARTSAEATARPSAGTFAGARSRWRHLLAHLPDLGPQQELCCCQNRGPCWE